MKTQNAEWWAENAVTAAVPGDDEFPEGFDVLGCLRELFAGEDLVVEIGCGWGRLSQAFEGGHYVGMDISRPALAQASRKFPEHTFMAAPDKPDPGPTALLLWTVMLHIADHELAAFCAWLAAFEAPRIVIAEITGRNWRNEPHAYNRTPEDYIAALEGYLLAYRQAKPYARYRTEDSFTIMDFRRDQ